MAEAEGGGGAPLESGGGVNWVGKLIRETARAIEERTVGRIVSSDSPSGTPKLAKPTAGDNVGGGKYKPDKNGPNTQYLGAMFKSEGHARAIAREKLGKNPVYIGDNKYRSLNGKWHIELSPWT